ncbi:hypothetical protein ACW9HQ_38030, partial [Nocardia gipuzkoensis]
MPAARIQLKTVGCQLVPGHYRGMSDETRQQRRARERAEEKARTRPGPNVPPAVPPTPARDVGVKVIVTWYDDPEYTDEGFWHASWEEIEEEESLAQITTTMQGEDFAELVASIMGSIRQEWPSDDVTVTWVLDKDAEDEVEELGIILPATP